MLLNVDKEDIYTLPHIGPSPFTVVTSHSLSLQEKKKTWWHFTIIKKNF